MSTTTTTNNSTLQSSPTMQRFLSGTKELLEIAKEYSNSDNQVVQMVGLKVVQQGTDLLVDEAKKSIIDINNLLKL